MERLSGLDSAFLSMETPTMHLHVAIAAVIDPTTMAAPYEFEQLKAFIERRLMRDPAFRRRVVAVPFGLNHPIWVEDPDIDLDYHIRRHVLPFPGGPRELTDLTGSIVSVPLDRSRPLWEIHVVEGLYDGNVALIGKIHHAAVDGVSGAELFVHLFDFTPDAADTGPVSDPTPTGPVAPEHIPSDVELVGHALLSQARRTMSLPALIGRTARTITHLVNRHRDPETVVGAVPLRAPRTPWSAAITPHRSVAFARVKLSDLKRVRAAFDVKVNDVVLAVVSGAVRRYLAERDALPDEPLVGMCPVSVRGEDERGRPDNRVSAMFVYLRTDMEEVASRLRSIAHSTRGAKDDHHAIGAKFLQNWAEHAAPSTFALATRLYSRLNIADRHPPIYNVIVSNVPGPDFPLYLDGARLVATYPMGPIIEGAGLNVTVLSYLDNVDFGFLAGAELVPDVWAMADHVSDAMAELLEAAAAIDGGELPAARGGDESATPVAGGDAPVEGGDDEAPVAARDGGAAGATAADAHDAGAPAVEATEADPGAPGPVDVATNGDSTSPSAGTAAQAAAPVVVVDGPGAERAPGEAPKITRATARTRATGRKASSGRQAVAETTVAGAPSDQVEPPVAATGLPRSAGVTDPAPRSAGASTSGKVPARTASGETSPKKPAAKKPAVEKPAVEKPAVEKPAVEKPAAKKPAAKKPAAKKPAAKKPAAKKPAAKKPAAKKPAAKKPAAKKPAAKKPAAKKPAAKKSAAKKPAAKKPAAKKPAAKKPAAKKPAVEKPAAERPAAATSTSTVPAAAQPEATSPTGAEPTMTLPPAGSPAEDGRAAHETPAAPVDGVSSTPADEPTTARSPQVGVAVPDPGVPAEDVADVADPAVVALATMAPPAV